MQQLSVELAQFDQSNRRRKKSYEHFQRNLSKHNFVCLGFAAKSEEEVCICFVKSTIELVICCLPYITSVVVGESGRTIAAGLHSVQQGLVYTQLRRDEIVHLKQIKSCVVCIHGLKWYLQIDLKLLNPFDLLKYSLKMKTFHSGMCEFLVKCTNFLSVFNMSRFFQVQRFLSFLFHQFFFYLNPIQIIKVLAKVFGIWKSFCKFQRIQIIYILYI